jgi:hypothetical protein
MLRLIATLYVGGSKMRRRSVASAAANGRACVRVRTLDPHVCRPLVARSALGERCPHRLEERHVVADLPAPLTASRQAGGQRLLVRHRQREGARPFPHRAQQTILAVRLPATL